MTPLNEHGGDIRRIGSRYGVDPEKLLDFSSNINPLGHPKGFRRALCSVFDEIVRYPEIAYHPLSSTISRQLGVDREKILLGNGSTELLYLLPLALKLQRCIICSPSYTDYERALKRTGISTDVFQAKEKDNFHWDLVRLSRKVPGYDMVVIGNPNNPTSVYTPKQKILDLVHAHPQTRFLVDEAFIDFLPGPASLIGADMPPNLLVLKSLTKFYAIPGLRLGCLVASGELINRFSTFQEPWTVNCLAAGAGEFLLQQNDYKEKTQAFISREKEYLFRGLAAVPGLKPFPPAVNFILVKIVRADITSADLKDKMIRKGILIRDCANFKGLSNRYFRVSVNTRKENRWLLAELRKGMDI